jgi:hypothetical protein
MQESATSKRASEVGHFTISITPFHAGFKPVRRARQEATAGTRPFKIIVILYGPVPDLARASGSTPEPRSEMT